MGTMIFNGVSSSDMGLVIQAPPSYEFPEKDYELIHVPGRSGDIARYKGSFQNVERTYNFGSVFRKTTNFAENAGKILSWLTSSDSYAILEDSYEPDYYRLALFKNSGEMYNYNGEATAIQATFVCKPQRYLKEGNVPLEFASVREWIEIINPTAFNSSPSIKIEANGPISGTIEVQTSKLGFFTVAINSSNSVLTIDSESQNCYSLNGNDNRSVTLSNNAFPRFSPETNKIRCTGNITKLTVIPRWWVL